jgi:aarF domain-containing kinase
LSRRKSRLAEPPPFSTGRRLTRLGAAGAGVIGRSSLASLRKLGAGPEKRTALEVETREANALQIVDALAQLKGPLLKLGQILSQQSHILPEEYVRRLSVLQRSAPPMHGTLARRQFRSELGRYPEELFAWFEREPFAAASLGQVHRARSVGGEELAVKIQYPGIESAIQADFNLLQRLLQASGWSARHPELGPALDEVRGHIEEETDYVREAAIMDELRLRFASERDVKIPFVRREFSARRVLTMERLEGLHVAEFLRTDPPQAERDRLATRLLALFFRQTLALGLFQADPHPGNYLFLSDGGIGLLDFGCAKRLDAEFIAEHRRLYQIPVDDEPELTACYLRLRLLNPGSPRFEEQLALLLRMQRLDTAKYHRGKPFDFGDGAYLKDLSACLRDLLRCGLANPDFILYVRTKMGLYNLFHQLGARIDCRKVVEPYR